MRRVGLSVCTVVPDDFYNFSLDCTILVTIAQFNPSHSSEYSSATTSANTAQYLQDHGKCGRLESHTNNNCVYVASFIAWKGMATAKPLQ